MKKRIISMLLAAVMALGIVLQLAPSALAATTVTVTDSAGVNMREGPGISYTKLTAIPANTVLTVEEIQQDDEYTWGKVTFDTVTGWIALKFTDYTPETTEPDSTGTWVSESGKWYYYIDGSKATGWIKDNGQWYFLNSDGVMQIGWIRNSGNWYYLNYSGVMQTGWFKQGGKTYYLDQTGIMQTGWTEISGLYYYFDSNGIMQTGWLEQDDALYYLKADGSMAVGKVMIDGQPNKFDSSGKWIGYAKYMTSDACLDLIKLEEGFSTKPYWDYAQYTVGYGTRCPDDKVDYYLTYGITVAEAELLLRDYLTNTEDTIESFIDRYALELSAQQFDALVMFSYNCGSGWTSETDGTFHNAIKNGATGSELIRAFVLWSSAGGEIKDFLIRRRLCEANMYLNGVYSQTPPDHYGYVLYDANGGAVSFRIQGYDSKEGTAPYTPTHDTLSFAGWYTASEGGSKVTALTMAESATTLYARWVEPGTTPSEPEETPDSAAKTNIVTVTATELNVRKGPGTDYEKVTQIVNGTQVAIAELKTVDGYTWGRYTDGWIRLDYTDYDPDTFQLLQYWVAMDGKWYYYKDGTAVKYWHKIGGKWYFFDTDGVMAAKQWRKDSKGWCYLGSDGAMMTNAWVRDSKGWCYVGADGYCLTNQWAKDSTGWIWLDSEGSMTKNQWIKVYGKWYYLDSDGYMVTGWKQIDGEWYYLNSEGIMQSGWLKLDGNWYFLNGSGVMQTGWLLSNGNWFYLYDDGVMATGTVTIGPLTYSFDANGVWLG